MRILPDARAQNHGDTSAPEEGRGGPATWPSSSRSALHSSEPGQAVRVAQSQLSSPRFHEGHWVIAGVEKGRVNLPRT